MIAMSRPTSAATKSSIRSGTVEVDWEGKARVYDGVSTSARAHVGDRG